MEIWIIEGLEWENEEINMAQWGFGFWRERVCLRKCLWLWNTVFLKTIKIILGKNIMTFWDERVCRRKNMSAVDWTVSCQSSYAEVLTSVPRNVLGDGAFKEVTKVKWGHMGGPQSNLTDAPIKRGNWDTDRHRKTMWRQREKVVTYRSRREVSKRNQSCPHLDLGFLASRTVRK